MEVIDRAWVREVGYGRGQRRGWWVIPPERVGVGRRRMGRRREWLGSAKSQMGWGFLVGLVRECTTGFAAWAAAPHG